MTTPAELQSAARAPYGPAAGRPSAASMGDKALYVDPGDNQALWQVQSGNWVKIALGSGGGATPGVPVLHGPYVVDYPDLAHDGDSVSLWTPQAGDTLFGLFSDPAVYVSFGATAATYRFGQDNSTDATAFMADTGGGDPLSFQLPSSPRKMILVPSGDPIRILRVANGDADLVAGHIEFYALVARAVAP